MPVAPQPYPVGAQHVKHGAWSAGGNLLAHSATSFGAGLPFSGQIGPLVGTAAGVVNDPPRNHYPPPGRQPGLCVI